jgi:hypothetical protein
MIDREFLTSQLTRNAESIRQIVDGLSDEQARWKPDLESWSILEVINHLYDEEREDFRVRLDGVLYYPDRPLPGIDPQGWVTERQYNQRELKDSVTDFLLAREESLAWLKGLDEPNWDSVYVAPFGPITAGDIFASWVTHDLLHMRQLVELHWAYTVGQVTPFKVDYAGTW